MQLFGLLTLFIIYQLVVVVVVVVVVLVMMVVVTVMLGLVVRIVEKCYILVLVAMQVFGFLPLSIVYQHCSECWSWNWC